MKRPPVLKAVVEFVARATAERRPMPKKAYFTMWSNTILERILELVTVQLQSACERLRRGLLATEQKL